jgi:LPXTG-site transpeptidase (sortase) family protein
MAEKLNILKELRKVFLFFCLFFVLVFLTLNLINLFNFLGKQAAALMETEIQFSSLLSETASPLPLPKEENFVSVEKEDSLEIPKIEIEAPLIFAQSSEIKEITRDLKNGVVVYPGSDSPGQTGRLTIIGHSAPLGWPKIRYDWVFSKLGELEASDEILINFEKKQYRYQITKKIFLEKGQPVPEQASQDSGQIIYLITCWPPGRDLRRLAIEAVGLTN